MAGARFRDLVLQEVVLQRPVVGLRGSPPQIVLLGPAMGEGDRRIVFGQGERETEWSVHVAGGERHRIRKIVGQFLKTKPTYVGSFVDIDLQFIES